MDEGERIDIMIILFGLGLYAISVSIFFEWIDEFQPLKKRILKSMILAAIAIILLFTVSIIP